MGVRLIARPRPLGPELDRIAQQTLLEAGAVAEARIRELITAAERTDTGLLANAVHSGPIERTSRGWQVVTAVAPPRDVVAIVHEAGRRPGKRRPPVSAILPWAKRQLGNRIYDTMRGAALSVATRRATSGVKKPRTKAGDRRAAHERAVAFLIARAIGRRGIKGIHMFQKTAAYMREGRINAIYAKYAARARP